MSLVSYLAIIDISPLLHPITCVHLYHLGHVMSVRLVDGPDESRGRVEVKNGGEWGTICRDMFNDRAAKVLCRMLGQR